MATHIEADGPNVTLGAVCRIESRSPHGSSSFDAEVVKVDDTRVVLSPFDDRHQTFAGALVTAEMSTNVAAVGPGCLGRAVDALGRPIDGGPTIPWLHLYPLHGRVAAPLLRVSSAETLETGIRAIVGLLTLGKGQRIGIFAAAGVGKTTLLSQLARQTHCDVIVLCLIGERGREVESIWNHGLDEKARSRSMLVAATSDQSASMRVRAAYHALAAAEYWRDEGKHVLLVLDSVTRLAMALREIGLSSGEPPTVRAYTPNVFTTVPKLVERCGALKSGGAITAVMTVLSETDEIDDPVSELMKSLLDGHILLSRTLAEQGHFPAIHVTRSVSRQAEGLVSAPHRRLTRQVLEWLSLHESSRTLVETGLYARGTNASLDRAIERHPEIVRFLHQGRDQRVSLEESHAELSRLVAGESQ